MYNFKCSVTPEDTHGKYIFWDIDGTLAPYRFDGKVGDVPGFFDSYCPFIEDGFLRDRHPSKFMQKLLPECNAKQHIVCGHYRHTKEITDKQFWISHNYPYIHKQLYVYVDNSKADAILEYCSKRGISLSGVMFVDDVLPILKEAESKGIESWHISSFMDWFM